MDVIINCEIAAMPKGVAPLKSQGNFYLNILASLGFPLNKPPLADWLRQYHELEGEWLIVSPIHWHATHNDAMIIAIDEQLELTEEESKTWFAAVEEFVAEENMQLRYHNAYIWLLQAKNQPVIDAKPVHALLHQSIMPELSTLDSTLFWQRFITETQMLLNSHELNQNRRDKYSINGLWIWGADKVEAITKPIFCNNEKICGLAKSLTSNVHHYDFSKPIDKNATLVLTDIDDNKLLDLQILLEQYTVNWYWNNIGYTSRPKSWWLRLWR